VGGAIHPMQTTGDRRRCTCGGSKASRRHLDLGEWPMGSGTMHRIGDLPAMREGAVLALEVLPVS
jgi:hypothetical protein